jgi:hypothetical protein
MKIKFEVNEQEKKEILEQHNLFKKVLQSKVTKLMVNEQTQSTGGGVEFLKAARDKKCKIAVGGVIHSAPGKPSVLHKVADYDSDNGYFKKGDEIYIKDDFTFDVVSKDVSGNKILSAKNKKWACDALTRDFKSQVTTNLERLKTEANWLTKEELISSGQTIENIENPLMYTKKDFGGNPRYQAVTTAGIFGGLTQPQKDKINDFKDMGYKLIGELTPKELSFFKPMVVSPVKDGLFSTDLIMYADPSQITQGVGETKTNITQTIKNAVQNRIPKDKKDCKDTIKTYYYAFDKKRPLSQDEFSALKEKTQACKNEFYGDWDVLSGGRKMDNYLDIMSGGKGGPSRRGEKDSKWLLN